MLVKTRNKKRIAVFFMTVVMMLTVFEYGGGIVSLAEEEQTEGTELVEQANYNYAKLLQYSLYLYDANMCGNDVSSSSLLDWRGNCHTNDGAYYTRNDGSTVWVDLSGGFHDAGDHVKFGLPEAFSAFTLGMSYDVYKDSYQAAGQSGHLQTITTKFADYLVKCTVFDSYGNVEAFCCQVGQGGGGFDHGYWGPPENQSSNSSNRPVFFTSASEPSTDIVSLSAAALVMQYKNFGGSNYLETAKKLFSYAYVNQKKCNTSAGSFYSSSGWADDYCLAAIMLYNATGDGFYLNEYNQYKNEDKAKNVWWPYGWDNTAPALAYYSGNASSLKSIMDTYKDRTNSDGYVCVNEWGSARYNTSMQFTGLLYDKAVGGDSYLAWAESQMGYILGSNPSNRCYVVGYSANSSRYPHHRAASGYTGGPKGTTEQAHVLLGALVGGPKTGGGYSDTADDYQCNEVAIDYNACLVSAAAALYYKHIGEGNQYIDSNYYSDNTTLMSNGIYVAESSRYRIVAAMATNQSDISNIEYSWYATKDNGASWQLVNGWTKGNNCLVWTPDTFGEYAILCKARKEGDDSTTVEAMASYSYHPVIYGKCQMPYTGPGGGWLIGVESYENPNQSYQYEMLILDCNLYVQGKDAWIYTTGKCGVAEGKALWVVWQPVYGYYWTLFRVYDKDGNMLDEVCYGFENVY